MNGVQQYGQNRFNTASREELLLMLFDGLMRFLATASAAMTAGEWGKSATALSRALAIVLELRSSLNHEVAPELTTRLASVYTFASDRLVHANLTRSAKAVDEVGKVLAPLRDGFAGAWEKIRAERASGVPTAGDAGPLRATA